MKARVEGAAAQLSYAGRRLCASCLLFCYPEYPAEDWQITFTVASCECPKCRHYPAERKW